MAFPAAFRVRSRRSRHQPRQHVATTPTL
jgi:hypothetical protein